MNQNEVMTTQSTGKGYKMMKLISFLGIMLGGILTLGGSGAGFWILLVSVVIGIGASFGAWWDHG
jgi:hypothetical protein